MKQNSTIFVLILIVLLIAGYIVWNSREVAPLEPEVAENTETLAPQTVQLYFYDPNRDKDEASNVLCSSKGLVPVSRSIRSMTPAEHTLDMLIAGDLTPAERAQGITTEFPIPGVDLVGVALSEGGRLRVGFSDPEHKLSGGSCRTAILAAQVTATAMQFPEVSSVEFLPEDVFQP